MSDQIKGTYNGTNVGKFYLSDIEKRLGLGGAQEGNYKGGQDQYIIWGETVIRTVVMISPAVSIFLSCL